MTLLSGPRAFSLKVDSLTEVRPWEERDAPQLYALTERERKDLREWLPWVDGTRCTDDTRRFIRAAMEQQANHQGFHAGIWVRERLAGGIGYRPIDWPNRNSEIGYWLSREFRGRGIMTSVCRTVLNYSFDELALHRMMIRCAVGNNKSRAIAERLGLGYEGIMRHAEYLNDRYVDLMVFSILSHEWRAKQALR